MLLDALRIRCSESANHCIHAEASNNAVRSMCFHDDWVCDSSLLHARQLQVHDMQNAVHGFSNS